MGTIALEGVFGIRRHHQPGTQGGRIGVKGLAMVGVADMGLMWVWEMFLRERERDNGSLDVPVRASEDAGIDIRRPPGLWADLISDVKSPSFLLSKR